MKAFVDTSALYALLVPVDIHHEAAQACFEQLELAEATLVSTNYVLLECASIIQRRHGFEAAKTFLTGAATLLDLIWIEETRHERATAFWGQSKRRNLSLVDCVSFVVMREHGLHTIVAFDAHFKEAGFDVLPQADRVAERRGVYRASRPRH